MTVNRLSIGLLVLALPLVAATVARAATTAVFVSTGSDHKVRATAITDANYEMGGTHTAYATAKVVSPDGRSAQSTLSGDNIAYSEVALDIGQEDGTFIGYNWQPSEYCPVLARLLPAQTVSEEEEVPKWVAVQDTSTSSSTIPKQSGEVTFTAEAVTSPSCSGSIGVIAHLTKNPSSIKATVAKDGDPGGSSAAVFVQTMSGASARDYDFHVRTHSSNQETGELTVSGQIDQSAGCQIRNIPGTDVVEEIQVTSN